MTERLKFQVLVVCTAALTAVFLPSQLVMAKEAKAIPPRIHGWWTQTYIEGIGSVQSDVPEKGMLVQNAPTGPIALSALRFSLQNGSAAKRLKVSISGTPVITQPPVACLATTAFESAQGGDWQESPEYDCERSVPGEVNAEQTQIRFAVGKLAKRRSVSVVLLAGGPTDRIAFAKPGPETLGLSIKTTSPAPPPPGPTIESGPTEPSTVSDEGVACCATGGSTLPTLRDEPDASVSQPNPVAASSTSAEQPAALPAAFDDIGGTRRALGSTLGVTLLLLSILYWSDGFGALGLRSSLATRYQGVNLTELFTQQAWINPEPVRAEDGQAGEGSSGQLTLPQ